MESASTVSYFRLRNDGFIDEEAEEKLLRRIQRIFRLRRTFLVRRRVKIGVRVRVKGLRRFWFSRKRSNVLSRFKVSCRKALKRLKKGKVHVNDLFNGNFLLMQASPTPLGRRRKAFMEVHHGLAFPAAAGGRTS